MSDSLAVMPIDIVPGGFAILPGSVTGTESAACRVVFAAVATEAELQTKAWVHPNGLDLAGLRGRLNELANLPEKWDSYDAPAPSHTAVEHARSVLVAIGQSGLVPTRIDPSVEGGVALVFFKGDICAMIECLNDGEIWADVSWRDGRHKAWQLYQEDDPPVYALEEFAAHLDL